MQTGQSTLTTIWTSWGQYGRQLGANFQQNQHRPNNQSANLCWGVLEFHVRPVRKRNVGARCAKLIKTNNYDEATMLRA